MRSWHLRDLVVDHKTGMLRETALWSNIGKATMTFAFGWQTTHSTLTEWYVAAYGAAVIFHELAARHFNQKQQIIDKETSNAQPPRTL